MEKTEGSSDKPATVVLVHVAYSSLGQLMLCDTISNYLLHVHFLIQTYFFVLVVAVMNSITEFCNDCYFNVKHLQT